LEIGLLKSGQNNLISDTFNVTWLRSLGLYVLEQKHERSLIHKNLFKGGVIKPVIDRTYSLEEIVEAHRYVEQAHKKGNVAITLKHDNNN